MPHNSRMRSTKLQLVAACEMAWIAMAYHEAATILVERGAKDNAGRYEYLDLPALNLLHHVTELLYKSALLQAGVDPPKTHNLATLEELCIQRAPAMAFRIPRSLGDYKPGMLDLFDNFPQRYFQALGLSYRYPDQVLPDTRKPRTDWQALSADLEQFKLDTRCVWSGIMMEKFDD